MATVQPNPIEGLYGIRGELNGRGIDNNRIGFNKNTGFVTIDGQNFIKPQTITKENLSYADPTAFNQQYNAFTSQNKLNSAQSNYEKALTQPVTNPYDTKINDTMSQFYDRIMNQKPYDPYSSPEYAAYQAQAQRQADQGIRTAQESLGAAGFGRSTNLAERAQGIQNGANEYLQTQVVPQLIAANQAQQQQEIANLGNYLERLTGQQGQFDTRSQQGLQNSMNFLNHLQGNRNQYANEQYQTGRDQASDKQFNDQFQYQQARDKIKDQQYQQEFDENRRQFGLNYAMDKAYKDGQLSLSQDDNNRQWAALDFDMANKANQSNSYNGMNVNQVVSSLKDQFLDENKKLPTDDTSKELIYQRVADYGLPDGQDEQAMYSLGLTSKDIAAFDKKYGVSSGN